MRMSLSRIAVIAVAALAVTACQPKASPSPDSGGGHPAPPPAPVTSRSHGGGTGPTSSASKGPLDNGDFDAVGFRPGQRVNCDNINSALTIRATGTVKWRAFVTTGSTFPWRVIDEVGVDPNAGTLAPGESATIDISGGITTVLHADLFYLTVEYANLPGAGHSYEFDCQSG